MTKGAIKHAAAGAVEGMKQRAKAYMVASLMGQKEGTRGENDRPPQESVVMRQTPPSTRSR